MTAMTLLMIGFTWMTELYFWGPAALWDYLPAMVICLIGAGLVALGNYMPRIRQNYTMGVRTPWALASEHCWQRTQRMGADDPFHPVRSGHRGGHQCSGHHRFPVFVHRLAVYLFLAGLYPQAEINRLRGSDKPHNILARFHFLTETKNPPRTGNCAGRPRYSTKLRKDPSESPVRSDIISWQRAFWRQAFSQPASWRARL